MSCSTKSQNTRSIYEEHSPQQARRFKTFTALIRLLIRQAEFKAAEERIYEGLKRFQDAARLQALMAQLQLCLKAYETAATFQVSAIELYRKQQKSAALNMMPTLPICTPIWV